MSGKKVLGYILIALSLLIAFSIIGQIKLIIEEFAGFINAVSGNYDTYDTTKAITSLVVRVIIFVLGVFLWTQGRKLIGKNP